MELKESDGYDLIKEIVELAKQDKPVGDKVRKLQPYYDQFPDIKASVNYLILLLAKNHSGVTH